MDVTSHLRESLDAAAESVNLLLRESQAAPSLVRHENGPWYLHFSTACQNGTKVADFRARGNA